MATLTEEQIAKLRTLAESSLYFFARTVLGFNHMRPELHGPLCQYLEGTEQADGRVLMFRGGLKTTLATVAHPLHLGVRDPNIRCLVTSNIIDNSSKMLLRIRQKVENAKLLQLLFPEVIPNFTVSKWSDRAACLNRDGDFGESTFEAAGLGTTITSRHYDRIIEDDTICAKKDDYTEQEAMPTQEDIDKAIAWHKMVPTYYVNPAKGRNLIVGTRWAAYDLEYWAEQNQPHVVPYIRPVYDEDGNSVYPFKLPNKTLEDIRRLQGASIFASQYLLDPLDPSLLTFQKDRIKYWARGSGDNPRVEYIPDDSFDKWWRGLRRALLIDPGLSQAKEACESAILVVGCDERGVKYVLDLYSGKPSPTKLVEIMMRMAVKWEINHVVPEKVGWQAAIKDIWELKAGQMGELSPFLLGAFIDLVPPGNQVSKDSRIRGLEPWLTGGMIKLGLGMAKLEQQISTFPYCRYKDLLDVLWYCLRIWPGLPPTIVEDEKPLWVDNGQGRFDLNLDKAIKATSEAFTTGATEYVARV